MTAAGSSSGSTLCKVTPFTCVSAGVSLDRVAAGVMGGECIEATLGLGWGEGLLEEVCVLCREVSRELSS